MKNIVKTIWDTINLWIISIERFLLKYMTLIIFFLIFLFIVEKDLVVKYKDLYFLIWWIFAFWYGYKKYERDKELEIIENYTKEYDVILKKLEDNNFKSDSHKLLDFWYKEFYLYSKWYISSELWKEWSHWIEEDIWRILSIELWKTFNEIWDKIKNNNKAYPDKINLINECDFISIFIEKYKPYSSKTYIKINNNTFPEFIISLLEKHTNKNKALLPAIKKLKSEFNLTIN